MNLHYSEIMKYRIIVYSRASTCRSKRTVAVDVFHFQTSVSFMIVNMNVF
jgi:hypothetical protein